MPVEIMAKRGPETIRFGPLKPVGLRDPRTGHRPWAVLQLRRENKEGTLLNLVGAQTMIDAQTNFLKNSKNKIPPVFMQDVIHGHRTLYPINLGTSR